MRRVAFVGLLMLFACAVRPAQVGIELSKSTVVTEDITPAGVPVLLRIETPNTGDEPVQLMFTGPGDAYEAGVFGIEIQHPGSAPQVLKPINAQYSQGRLHEVFVAPGGKIRTPLAIDTMDAGDYDAELFWTGGPFQKGPPVSLTHFKLHVVDDAKLRDEWIKKRIDEVRAGDEFAACVAGKYQIKQVVGAMLDDLTSDAQARV